MSSMAHNLLKRTMRIGDVIDFQVSFEGLPSLALRYRVLGHNLDGANNSLLRSRVQLTVQRILVGFLFSLSGPSSEVRRHTIVCIFTMNP